MNGRGITESYAPDGALVLWCSGALVLWCSGALVLWCSGALVLWCSGALVLWCSGALVLWCSQTNTHYIKIIPTLRSGVKGQFFLFLPDFFYFFSGKAILLRFLDSTAIFLRAYGSGESPRIRRLRSEAPAERHPDPLPGVPESVKSPLSYLPCPHPVTGEVKSCNGLILLNFWEKKRTQF